jgi:hypothetical protein
MKPLAIRYSLEIYESSFTNDPTVGFESSTPFLSFQKGDFIDPGMWDNLVDAEPRKWFQIKDVVHRIWEIKDSHIGHQISLCIVPAKRPE